MILLLEYNYSVTKEDLLEALNAAPFPLDENTKTIDPDDIQRWVQRYRIWYRDIRSFVLESNNIEPTENIYYQIDRLIQVSTKLRESASEPENYEQEEIEDEPAAPSIILGTVKKQT